MSTKNYRALPTWQVRISKDERSFHPFYFLTESAAEAFVVAKQGKGWWGRDPSEPEKLRDPVVFTDASEVPDLSDFNLTGEVLEKLEASCALAEMVSSAMKKQSIDLCNDGIEAQLSFLVGAGMRRDALEVIQEASNQVSKDFAREAALAKLTAADRIALGW